MHANLALFTSMTLCLVLGLKTKLGLVPSLAVVWSYIVKKNLLCFIRACLGCFLLCLVAIELWSMLGLVLTTPTV